MKSAKKETGLPLEGLRGNKQSKPPVKKRYNKVFQQLCLEDIGGTEALRILGGLLKGILENMLANKEKHKRWQKVERDRSQRTGTKTVTQSLLLPGQLRKLEIQEHASVFTSLH